MDERTRKVVHSSRKHDWGTPPEIFEKLQNQYDFTLDLCASESDALLPRYCDNVQSRHLIDKEWGDRIPINWRAESFYCNPPYGKDLPKILEAIPSYASGVFLLPSRTGSRWWIDLARKCDWCFFLKGRVTFAGGVYPAPFDSILMGMHTQAPIGFDGLCWDLRDIRGS